jgi:hypothetical protein
LIVVGVLGLDGGEVIDGLFVEVAVVVPVDPFRDGVNGAPGALAWDDSGLVQPVDALGDRVV